MCSGTARDHGEARVPLPGGGGRGAEAGLESPPPPDGGGGRLLCGAGHADVHLLHLLPPLLLHHLPRPLPPDLPALPGGGAAGRL